MSIFGIVTSLIGLGGNWIENKQKLDAAKTEAKARVEVARAEAEIVRLGKLQDAEISWEQHAVSQMHSSWKDEWWTLLVSIPLILAFLGAWGKDKVTEGFQAIATMPEWYIAIVFASVAASFGIRALAGRSIK